MKHTDVAILGGGLAGLSLALQLRQCRTDLEITVVDSRRRPAQERTSTVGESFAEVGSHYLREVVGLRDHLEADELPKFGLRFFVGRDLDLADRFEIGLLDPAIGAPVGGRMTRLPLPTHQVDRARLENEMARRCGASSVQLWEGTRVRNVRLDRREHRIELEGEGGPALGARWVVCAGGPEMPGIAPTRRGLGHRIRAAWLRVEGDLDVGRWSERETFLGGTLPGLRRLSTNHLMGPGYWIWVIPLPSGVTSLGVVVDPDAVDFAPSNLDELVAWLRVHDPRVHRELLRAAPADGEDLRVTDLDAGVATTCFSPERWALVGGAAAMVDVLYSPGADLIAIGNSLVCDLVDSETRSGRLGSHCAIAERVFGGFVEGLAELYRAQYRHFGNARLVASKVVWDSALYFGFHTLLFRHGVFGDPEFLAQIRPELLAVRGLQARVQARFRSGDIRPFFEIDDSPVEWGAVAGLMDNYYGAEYQPDRRAVLDQLRKGMSALERMARRLEGVS
jgi:flavin-dependent dehydrogenase